MIRTTRFRSAKLPLLWIIGLIVLSFESTSLAYPTLARHGYTTCATCHYNPSGGGILTSYGKFVAGELFGALNDSSTALPYLVNPKYEVGTFDEPSFDAMVMARVAQTYFDTPQVKRMDYRRMQFDFEGGYVHDGWQALAAVGPRLDSAIEGVNEKETIEARRYWLGRVTLKYAVRVGKFFPEYGINYYNHNIPTRKGLYFNHNEEPYNFQATYFTDTFDYTIAALKGAKNTKLEDMKGYSGTLSYKTGKVRFGLSHLNMKSDARKTHSQGVFLQAGYLEKGYTLFEVDTKSSENVRGISTDERVGYVETGWEFWKGVNPYLAADYTANLNQDLGVQTPKLGAQIHLITHTDLIIEAGRSIIKAQGQSQYATHALAMLNLYF